MAVFSVPIVLGLRAPNPKAVFVPPTVAAFVPPVVKLKIPLPEEKIPVPASPTKLSDGVAAVPCANVIPVEGA